MKPIIKYLFVYTFLTFSMGTALSQVKDISDTLFSIQIPKAESDNVDFGRVPKYKIRDSIFKNLIVNKSLVPVRIDTIYFKGYYASEFENLSKNFPFVIQPGFASSPEFRFKPKTNGVRIARMIVVTQTDTLDYKVKGEAVETKIISSTDTFNFGSGPVFSKIDSTFRKVLKNLGSSSVKLNSCKVEGDFTSPFSVELPEEKKIIRQNSELDLKVTFSPQKTGYFISKLSFTIEEDPEPYKVFISATSTPIFATVKGKVTDKSNNPIGAKIGWELMTENFINSKLGSGISDSLSGEFEIKLEIGNNYAIYFEKNGFSAHSDVILLADSKEPKEIIKNLILEKPLDGNIKLNNIFFEHNKSDLKPESFTELNRLLEVLKFYSELNVEISGHTDNVGNDNYNKKLSQERANTVVSYLIKKGLKARRITAKGYGKTKPVDTNETESGRSKNRRVEFNLLKP